MAIKHIKSYRFAFFSALYIAIFLMATLLLIFWLTNNYHWQALLLFLPFSFFIPFAFIQIRIEKFIYRRVKKIYDDVSLLESSSFSSKYITTDMKTLTEEIERFAQDKKIEIDTLKIREEYRKDFLGNVSHELKTPLFTVQGYIETLLSG